MRFQDKVAIVTGGSSGIGKEVATRFVAEGGSVVIIGRDAAKAEAAAKQVDATEIDQVRQQREVEASDLRITEGHRQSCQKQAGVAITARRCGNDRGLCLSRPHPVCQVKQIGRTDEFDGGKSLLKRMRDDRKTEHCGG